MSEEIVEGLTASGLYCEGEDGEQQFIPRKKQDNHFELTMEQLATKEKWLKEMRRDFPNVDETTIDFVISFYMKDPKEYEELVKANINKPSRYEKGMLELQKQYGKSKEQEQKEEADEFKKFCSDLSIQHSADGLETGFDADKIINYKS